MERHVEQGTIFRTRVCQFPSSVNAPISAVRLTGRFPGKPIQANQPERGLACGACSNHNGGLMRTARLAATMRVGLCAERQGQFGTARRARHDLPNEGLPISILGQRTYLHCASYWHTPCFTPPPGYGHGPLSKVHISRKTFPAMPFSRQGRVSGPPPLGYAHGPLAKLPCSSEALSRRIHLYTRQRCQKMYMGYHGST